MTKSGKLLKSKEDVNRYKVNTLYLCLWLREIQKYADMQSKGEDFDKEKFIYACKMCEQYKLDFISSKESLGFTDKFKFMETNHFFDGFSIVDGKFVGDVTDEQLFAITDKWYYGFPVSANHYQFEVSCYAMTLFDTEDRTGMLYKDFKK